MTKERGILFSGPMVRAILEGRKTQTRRVMKPQPSKLPTIIEPYNKNYERFAGWITRKGQLPLMVNDEIGNAKNTCHWKCPYGVPGDRLYVRESYCWKVDPVTDRITENEYWYQADGVHVVATDDDGWTKFRKDGTEASPWIPSIHMPKKASRILTEITGIRAELLTDISERDALAEGFKSVEDFKNGWNEINGARGYQWGPLVWVWVIEFKVLEIKCQ